MRPHLHFFTSHRDMNLQEDVREVPSWFQDPSDFETTLRDFFRLFHVDWKGTIRIVEAERLEF